MMEFKLKKKNMQRRMLTGSFLLPFMIMLALFVIKGIYPFGDRSFVVADMYHQYMPFFSELLHKVRGGESLNFSFTSARRNIGRRKRICAVLFF